MSVSFIEPDFSELRGQQKTSRERDNSVQEKVDTDLASASQDSTTINRPKVPRSLSNASNSSCLSSGSVRRRRQSNGPFVRRVSFDTITAVSPSGAPVSETGQEANESSTSPRSGSFQSSGPMPSTVNSNSFFFRTPIFASTSATTSNTGTTNGEPLTPANGLTSYFVSYRHQELQWMHNTRTFLFAYTNKEYSIMALKWLVSNLVQDGDELVCIKHYVTDGNSDDKKPCIYQKEAEMLLEKVIDIIGPDMKINVIVELGVGKVKTVVHKSLLLYQPSVVVVGANQKSFSNLSRMRYKKSVSSYLIAKSQVPVVMVTPWMIREISRRFKPMTDSNTTIDASLSSARPTLSRNLSDSYDFTSNNPYLSAVAAMAENRASTNDPTFLSLTKVDTEYEETPSSNRDKEVDHSHYSSSNVSQFEVLESSVDSTQSSKGDEVKPCLVPPMASDGSDEDNGIRRSEFAVKSDGHIAEPLLIEKSETEVSQRNPSLARQSSTGKWKSRFSIGSLWSKSKKI